MVVTVCCACYHEQPACGRITHGFDVLEKLDSFCMPLILSSDPTSGVEQRHSISCPSSGLHVRPCIPELSLSLLVLRMLEGSVAFRGLNTELCNHQGTLLTLAGG